MNLKSDKVLSTLSIAAKAGKIVSGELSVEKAVKTGSAMLVIVADDASYRTKKRFTDMFTYYDVPVCIYSDKESLGHFIGKEFRASLCVVDEGLAASVMKKLAVQNELKQNNGGIVDVKNENS